MDAQYGDKGQEKANLHNGMDRESSSAPEAPGVPVDGTSNLAVSPESEITTQTEIQPGTSESEARLQMIDELDRMIVQVRRSTPDYSPPPFSPHDLLELIERNLRRLSPDSARLVLQKLRSILREDFLDIETWKSIWYMLNYFLEYQSGIIRKRMAGEYQVDEWGYDPDFVNIITPFMNFMYRAYWRVEVSGIENLPLQGRAMLVSNHSGQIPWDGTMLATAVHNLHPNQRLLRNLYSEVFPAVPFVSLLLVKLGQVMANEDNALRLLEQDQLVGVFPEGHKGVSKVFKDRYRLQRFGRGGFASIALRAGAPVVPVSIVGAEETYITLYQAQLLARIVGLPFFPITITWPWLGLLGFIPLPTKWYIDIGEPIYCSQFGSEVANSQVIVSQLSDLSRNVIQNMVFERLAKRKSIFWG